MNIVKELGEPAVLEQLAEECTELAQAALKYARLMRGENPTPKTEEECLKALAEEMADTRLCIDLIDGVHHFNYSLVMDAKEARWKRRIEENGNDLPNRGE